MGYWWVYMCSLVEWVIVKLNEHEQRYKSMTGEQREVQGGVRGEEY